MISRTMKTIGTFDIEGGEDPRPFVVTDRCSFNDWGEERFETEAEAIAYAEWAHAFKTGRTTAPSQHEYSAA